MRRPLACSASASSCSAPLLLRWAVCGVGDLVAVWFALGGAVVVLTLLVRMVRDG